MDNERVAAILEEIGTLLEVQGENAFRCRAYYNAAHAIRQMGADIAELVAQGKLAEIPAIGKTLEQKITALVRTGKLDLHEELKRKTPPGLVQLLRLPGLGTKKIKLLHEELQIIDLESLRTACIEGRVAILKGFGKKTQAKILQGIAFVAELGERVRIDEAEAIAQPVLDAIKMWPGVQRAAICGSLRRRKETVNDLDFLVSAAEPTAIMERFSALPGVEQVVARGDSKATVTLKRGLAGGKSVRLNADLRVVRDEHFPFALHYFTGSKEHNVALRQRALQLGMRLNEYELNASTEPVLCSDEAQLFEALELEFIPPELREHTGEIAAAADHRLPTLVRLDDLQGTFHCHTNWSDGNATLQEMIEAAQNLGLRYIGIADHSQSLTVANGLRPERVRQQQAEIDSLAKQTHGLHIFKGIECDILGDGRLDYDETVLATFDYVVASVHSLFRQTEEEMTARIVRAVSHPRVTMLGHATGRLLLRREGYKVNLDEVLKAAALHGTMIEINAHPQRLDLDWVHCRRAKELGVQLVINPDAHNVGDLGYLRYGVDVARRAWLEKEDVFNTRSAAEIVEALRARKARAERRV